MRSLSDESRPPRLFSGQFRHSFLLHWTVRSAATCRAIDASISRTPSGQRISRESIFSALPSPEVSVSSGTERYDWPPETSWDQVAMISFKPSTMRRSSSGEARPILRPLAPRETRPSVAAGPSGRRGETSRAPPQGEREKYPGVVNASLRPSPGDALFEAFTVLPDICSEN
jgi:hypothetical protein